MRYDLTTALIILIGIYKNAHSQDLIIKAGQTDTIRATTYIFNNIIIDGTLVIKEKDSWCILWSLGDFKLNGTIIARGFKVGPRRVAAKTPEGQTVEHYFKNEMLGGRGGNGGTSKLIQGLGKFKSATFHTDSAVGGKGAFAGMSFGGGGGSGGGIYLINSPNQIGAAGADGIDWMGGELSEGGFGNVGGNGGQLPDNTNGGLLLIYSKNNPDICRGTIDLRGLMGVDGYPGGDGSISSKGLRGAGGGGGGSPGGDGGRLILISDKLSECSPQVLTEGGLPGRGGAPGKSYGQVAMTASKGEDGQHGLNGYVEIFTTAEWRKRFK